MRNVYEMEDAQKAIEFVLTLSNTWESHRILKGWKHGLSMAAYIYNVSKSKSGADEQIKQMIRRAESIHKDPKYTIDDDADRDTGYVAALKWTLE